MKKSLIHPLTTSVLAVVAGILILLYPDSGTFIFGIYLIVIGGLEIFGKYFKI